VCVPPGKTTKRKVKTANAIASKDKKRIQNFLSGRGPSGENPIDFLCLSLLLCNAMHITASVFINDDESGLHDDYERWLERLAPHEPISQYLRMALAKSGTKE
jgi:hypothetical protein